MKEAPGSSETSVLTRATRRNNPEDTILHRVSLVVYMESFKVMPVVHFYVFNLTLADVEGASCE
jgi:hypothetical protein